MPSPSFTNEVFKLQNMEVYNKKVRFKDIPDLREMDPASIPQLEIIHPYYLPIRLGLMFQFWPYLMTSIDSKWTSIRKVTYKILACMLNINVHNYDSVLTKRLKKEFPLLINSLLESHDSE